MSDALKSTFDVGAGTISPNAHGRNGGPMGNDANPAQFIKTVEFCEVAGKSANVDGSFRDGMKPDLSSTASAQPSPRPASQIFSSFDTPGNESAGSKSSSGGGGVKSSMGY